MLHIVNGDSFGSTLRQSGIEGDILVWREALYEGPLSVSFTDAKTREARVKYFAERGVPAETFHSYTKAQEDTLLYCSRYEEIVLWFEFDLFDQTMMIYLLQWFYNHGHLLHETKLFLVCIDSFPGVHPFKGLGQLTPEQTRQLNGTWRQVSREQLLLAHQAWCAYASPNPQAVTRLLEQDTSALPYLHRALKFHLERFPSDINGLSRVEQLTLEALSEGIDRLPGLFGHISEALPEYGIGDVQYWGYLKGLRYAPEPLIEMRGPELPGYSSEVTIDIQQWQVRLTSCGERIMSGESDNVSLNGINRWIGGTILCGKASLWRWNSLAQKFVQK